MLVWLCQTAWRPRRNSLSLIAACPIARRFGSSTSGSPGVASDARGSPAVIVVPCPPPLVAIRDLTHHHAPPATHPHHALPPTPERVDGAGASSVCIRVRGRVEKLKVKSKVAFFLLKEPGGATVQVVVLATKAPPPLSHSGTTAPFDIVRSQLTNESVVDVVGMLVPTAAPIRSATIASFELHATVSLTVVSAAQQPLPFPLDDRHTKLSTRLDHRSYDLRRAMNHSIFQISSIINGAFRDFFSLERGRMVNERAFGIAVPRAPQQQLPLNDDPPLAFPPPPGWRTFVEIHTPKTICSPSEGGSSVFKLDYFGQPAYLAQSPQLYKQMCVLGDLATGGVFEIGPVFRAENSNTHRHLTEFMGLDVEMLIDGEGSSATTTAGVVGGEKTTISNKDGGALPKLPMSSASPSQLGHEEVLNVLEAAVRYVVEVTEAQCRDALRDVRQELELTFALEQPSAATAQSVATNSDEPPNDSSSSSAFVPLVCAVPAAFRAAPTFDEHATRYGARVTPRGHLRMTFDGAIRLLMDRGVLAAWVNDFSTDVEKKLGAMVKGLFGVDLYVVDQYPLSARPFYTMPLEGIPTATGTGLAAPLEGDRRRTRSFDMFLRGEEICSGAQRIHDSAYLEQRAKECGVSVALIRGYLAAFRYGCWPHGGFGIGLERLVMLFIGAPNVRYVTLFPRDPTRLSP